MIFPSISLPHFTRSLPPFFMTYLYTFCCHQFFLCTPLISLHNTHARFLLLPSRKDFNLQLKSVLCPRFWLWNKTLCENSALRLLPTSATDFSQSENETVLEHQVILMFYALAWRCLFFELYQSMYALMHIALPVNSKSLAFLDVL